MWYRLLVDAVVVLHLLFLAYVALGGFLAWRWPATVRLHVLAVVWGFGTVVARLDCPLTRLENWARERGGEAPLPSSGFIAHYLTGVIYPENALGAARALVAVAVIVSWLGFVTRRTRSRPTV